MDSRINYDFIVDYIRKTIKPNDEFLRTLEGYAKENYVPIVQPETAKFIELMCKLKRPKRILEVGTAIGYSSILMAKSLNARSNIDTIEINEDIIQIAEKNIKEAGFENNISILHGDAKEVLSRLDKKYDFIFIDAAKGQYMEYFKECIRMLDDDGFIITDNVLYKGLVANDELVERRNRTIAKRLREFLDYICNDKEFESSLIPIGDGICLTIKNALQKTLLP